VVPLVRQDAADALGGIDVKASAVLSCGWCGHRRGTISELGASKYVRGPCENCDGTGKLELELRREA